ncbi:MAG: hypothetical protein M3246_09765 [Actinomycetota bacterium]|nr:hypothetical protein [Actinomycetota bacterium]
MLAAARAMLKVRTLTDLNGAKADAVDAGSGAARDPPDTVLVAKLDAALLKEQPTALYAATVGFLRRTR